MTMKNRARCSTERCHKYAQAGYPYCPKCLEGFMGELPEPDVTEIRLPGWEYRQAARERKANASVRVEEMAPGGKLEWWKRRLKEQWRKAA